MEREAHLIELAVDRPEVAGVHLAVAGASGLDRRLVHGLDAARADRGVLRLVDRRQQADDVWVIWVSQGRLTLMPAASRR